MNREILILDEATSELDGASVERIEKEILSFKERGGAVVFATHNPSQAQRLADRIFSSMMVYSFQRIMKLHNSCSKENGWVRSLARH